MERKAQRPGNRLHTGCEPRARFVNRALCSALSGDTLGTGERKEVWRTSSPCSL